MPAAVPLIGLAVSAGTSIYSAAQANKRAKEAQKAIDNYQRQDLTNPYENTQVSTLGADRQREDLARAMATNANLAAMGGSRAILGLAPQMIAQQNAQEAQIMANLDEQEKQRQQLIAGGGMQVQNMQEQRENNDLLGLGNALQTARAERMNAVNQLVQTGVSAASLATSGYLKGNNNTSAATNVGVKDNYTGILKNVINPLAKPSWENVDFSGAGTTVERIPQVGMPTYQAPNYAQNLFPTPMFGVTPYQSVNFYNPYNIRFK